MLNINEEDLKAAIVDKAANAILRYGDDLPSMVRAEVKERLDKIFAERVNAQIHQQIDEAVLNLFNHEYQRVTAWGQPEGEPTTMRKELEKTVTNYWSAKVDSRTGKADAGYNGVSRAEYLMTQICAEDFTKHVRDAAVNVTATLKDGMRNQMAKVMDQILSELFHVKSLQDQGKAPKPY